MSSCTDHEPLILDRVMGALSAADQATLDGHLAGCAQCRQRLATGLEAVRLAALAPLSTEEQDALHQISARARAAFGAHAEPRRLPGLRVAAVLAAAACSLAVLLNVGAWGKRSAAAPSVDPAGLSELAAWALDDPLEDADAADDLEDEVGLELEGTEQTP